MGFLKMGNRFKNRKFDYIPRYYDQDKEELERRIKRYNQTSYDDTELAKQRIRGGFKKKMRAQDGYSSKSQKRSNRILLVTIIGLIILTVKILVDYLPRIIASLE